LREKVVRVRLVGLTKTASIGHVSLRDNVECRRLVEQTVGET
jgi:hypothetical protein